MSFPGTPAHIPTGESVAERHSDIAGLGVVLDPERRAELLTPLVGAHGAEGSRIERLRLKPGTSLTVALRVPVPNGDGRERWWRLRAFADQPWPSKSRKEQARALDAGRPALVDEDLRVVVVPAETDRKLGLLQALLPDSGVLVRLPGEAAERGPRWLRTLSYNPDRRWVGVAHDAEDRPRELLRLYSSGTLDVSAWMPGRPWSAADNTDAALTAQVAPSLAASLEAAQARGITLKDKGGAAARLFGAVTMLTAIDADLAQRAHFLSEQISPELRRTPTAPAHGDFTTDQVVIDDGRPGLLDWDHAGLWPRGWDAATWEAGQIRDGARPWDVTPLPGVEAPSPAVRAAALLGYVPDPFRRQLPNWGAATLDLISSAEETLS